MIRKWEALLNKQMQNDNVPFYKRKEMISEYKKHYIVSNLGMYNCVAKKNDMGEYFVIINCEQIPLTEEEHQWLIRINS